MGSRSRHEASVRYSADMRALVGEVRTAAREQTTAIRGVSEAITRQTTGWRGLGNDLARIRQSYLAIHGAMSAVARTGLALVQGAASEATELLQLDRVLRLHNTTYRDHADAVDAVTGRYNSLINEADAAVRTVFTAVGQRMQGANLSFQELQRLATSALNVMLAYGKDAQSASEIVAAAATGNLRALRSLLPEAVRGIREMGDEAQTGASLMNRLDEATRGGSDAVSAMEQDLIRLRNQLDAAQDDIGSFVSRSIQGWEQLAHWAAPGVFGDGSTTVGDPRLASMAAVGAFYRDRIDSMHRLRDQAAAALSGISWGGQGGMVMEAETIEGDPSERPRGRGGGRARQRNGSMWGASMFDDMVGSAREGLAEKAADAMQEQLRGLLDVKRAAWDAERALEEARTATLLVEADKRKQSLLDEIALERTRAQAARAGVGAIINSAQQIAGGVGASIKAQAVLKAVFATGEALMALFWGDPKAPIAFAAAAQYVTAAGMSIVGAAGAGGGRGGGGSYGRRSTSDPSTAGALMSGPARGDQRPLVVNVNYGTYWGGDSDRTTQEVTRHVEEGVRRGYGRRPTG